MPRKILALALVVVGLHVVEILTLGTSTAGSTLANSLQILSSGLAAAMCFGAARRGRGMSRPFWFLTGCGMATWGVANLGWMYYEIALRIEPPAGSLVRILFDSRCIFFAMALFLDQEKDSPRLDAESVLDFVQTAIVLFFLYLGFYYIPAQHSDRHGALLLVIWALIVEDAVLIALAVIQMARARSPHIRGLFRGLAVYLAIFTLGAVFAQWKQSAGETPTGTWLDLAWTLPFLWGAIWAAQWQPTAESQIASRIQPRTIGELIVTNITYSFAPLIILFQVSQLGVEWRAVRFSLLGASILCYAARLGISQFREAKSLSTAQMHSLAMESAINGMAILDPAGKYTYVNPAYARMFGYPQAGTIPGKNWREVANPRDVEPVEEEIRNTLQQHGKWFGPITAHHADGTVVPMEMAITALPGGGTICVSRDVTERQKAERARKETEVKFRMLVEQVAAVSYIAELGIHGEWIYVSPQVEAMFGYTPDEWLSDSGQWTRFVHPEDHPIIHAAEEACLKAGRFQAEYRVIRKDGKTIWVSDTAVVVPGSASHPLMEGILVDINERKLLENQLQQARRMEAVGRLAGGVAHDFNNLLTIIKGYIELALNRCQNQPALSSDIRHIEDASDRAVALVRQLLAFGRKQVLMPRILDLNAIVLNLDNLLRRLMSAKIDMKTMVGKDLGAIKADPGQIEQVILNLVVNARDAMPEGGRLVIETSNVDLDGSYFHDSVAIRPGPYILLAVTDTGVGMGAETVAHIFEPFYTTKESGRGTGLGLSTVYGIVKQSGGYIWVYSEPGKGSTFKVYLPRVDEPAEVSRAPETAEPAARKGNETILLVEDEPAVRELARIVLSERGYAIVEARSPEEAERLAGSRGAEIQLLLTDVMMPGISGRELARRINARHPGIRVLYMSGYTNSVIAEDGMLEAGLSFLQKPFTPQILVQRVRETLDRPVPAK